MRSMSIVTNDEQKLPIYTSYFSPENGTFLRFVRDSNEYLSTPIRSPSPELIDISITNKCGFGCQYCYQNSTIKDPHGRKDLIKKTILSLDHIPYQIAIGGGEPTLHPNFLEILQEAKELGTVPNYTTAGHNITEELIDITNNTCGGIAITFHAFKGQDWFLNKYKLLREKIKIQLNIHLIVDKTIVDTLPFLIDLQNKIGNINLILLAYYPDVGRATLDRALTKNIYMKQLPDLIKRAYDSKMNLAFSEGLLPFFLSRPELPINTQMATKTEGLYSCYINHEGKMFTSSFNKFEACIYPEYVENEDIERRWEKIEIAKNYSTVYGIGAQKLWNSFGIYNNPRGDACSSCKYEKKCATPSEFHYFTCAYASHNKESL